MQLVTSVGSRDRDNQVVPHLRSTCWQNAQEAKWKNNYTNTNTQIHKYKYTNTNTQIQQTRLRAASGQQRLELGLRFSVMINIQKAVSEVEDDEKPKYYLKPTNSQTTISWP